MLQSQFQSCHLGGMCIRCSIGFPPDHSGGRSTRKRHWLDATETPPGTATETRPPTLFRSRTGRPAGGSHPLPQETSHYPHDSCIRSCCRSRRRHVTHVSADEINLHAVLSECLSCFGKEFIAQIDSCHDMATLRQFDRMTAVAAWDVQYA